MAVLRGLCILVLLLILVGSGLCGAFGLISSVTSLATGNIGGSLMVLGLSALGLGIAYGCVVGISKLTRRKAEAEAYPPGQEK